MCLTSSVCSVWLSHRERLLHTTVLSYVHAYDHHMHVNMLCAFRHLFYGQLLSGQPLESQARSEAGSADSWEASPSGGFVPS